MKPSPNRGKCCSFHLVTHYHRFKTLCVDKREQPEIERNKTTDNKSHSHSNYVYDKWATVLIKNFLNIREPSKFKWRPPSLIANKDLIGLPFFKNILKVFRNCTLHLVQSFSSSLFTAFKRVSALSEGKSQGRGIIAEIIKFVWDLLLIKVIKFWYRLISSSICNLDGILFVPTWIIVYLKLILASWEEILFWIDAIVAPGKHCIVVWRMSLTCFVIESLIMVTAKGWRSII